MTVKQFFKGKAFKCLAALLCVLLVSGVFLTVMSGLLAVSDDERFDRAIKKIYGKAVLTEEITVTDPNPDSNATIEQAFKIKDDGNYLIKATGKGGFDNGTVTCWVVVKVSGGAVKGIEKVVIDSNKSQSYISNINDKFLSGFYVDYDGGYFNANEGFIKTGATRSATAICNAVNGAIIYVNAQLGVVITNVYENCSYTEYIDTRNTTHYSAADEVVFSVKTNGYGNAAEFTVDITVNKDGVITAYEIKTNGSTSGFDGSMLAEIKDGSLFVEKDLQGVLDIIGGGTDIAYPSGTQINTGATQSNFLCLNAAAFAAANYEEFLEREETPENPEGGEENE